MKPTLLPVLALAACLLVAGCGTNSSNNKTATGVEGKTGGHAAPPPARADGDFARDAVGRLLDGDVSIEGAYDWENLKVPGGDVGEGYREMPDEDNRQALRKAFIEKFSASFKQSGASAASLTNWREQSKNAEMATVVADAPNGKSIAVSVSHKNGQQKISEIAVR